MYAPKPHEIQNKASGYVYIDDQKIPIRANAHTISCYSAHAVQKDLINFVKRMRIKPKHILIVHGDEETKAILKEQPQRLQPEGIIEIGQ